MPRFRGTRTETYDFEADTYDDAVDQFHDYESGFDTRDNDVEQLS